MTLDVEAFDPTHWKVTGDRAFTAWRSRSPWAARNPVHPATRAMRPLTCLQGAGRMA